MARKGWVWLLAAIVLAGLAGPATAQLEDNLAAYPDNMAEGYLKPLQEAFGQTLNSNWFTTAYIPPSGLHARLDLKAMSVLFGDDDDTFQATTGGDFSPEQTVDASTVVGPGDAVAVTGDGGTVFVFPGGFDLNSFTLGVPQLTIGAIAGTEALIRFFSLDTGDSEIGDISFIGIGVRHSISQYMVMPPLDLAASITYQKLDVGEDLLNAKAFSLGVQGSKNFGTFTPYGGLSYDTISMDAHYEYDGATEIEEIDLNMEKESSLHATLGFELLLGPVHLNLSGDLAKRSGLSAGFGFGF
jgi:hypothetical protein